MILELAVAILVCDRLYQGGRQVYLQYKAEEQARKDRDARAAQQMADAALVMARNRPIVAGNRRYPAPRL